MGETQIHPSAVIGAGCRLGPGVSVGPFAVIEDHTVIGAGCRIGAHAFLGMFSVVTRDVPAYTTVAGHPAVPKGINSEGLKRREFSTDQIRNIKNAYRLVYRKGMKLAEAIEEIRTLVDEQPELEVFLASLTQSDRGIAR